MGLHPYLAGQGKPRDSHVGVQHLELGLQRQSHTGKRREREHVRGRTEPSACPSVPLSLCPSVLLSSVDTIAWLFLNQAAILMSGYLEPSANLVVASAAANLASGVNPCSRLEGQLSVRRRWRWSILSGSCEGGLRGRTSPASRCWCRLSPTPTLCPGPRRNAEAASCARSR